ncbi:MAG TPA: ABC transporter permease, partial [Rhodothermales bacterium]|nr:ABC transporter permease [Rhodothermales bacterium]
MFDLEKAIAAWRRQYRYRGRFLREDLDELERHLRDHIVHLLAEDYTPQQAFHEASRALGEAAGAQAEYRKVFWGKLWRRRHILSELHHQITMLKNYLKVALRTLKRHPGYAFINIFGLAVGMACCLLIGLYVHQEWSYDRFHNNADRIYRVTTDLALPDAPPSEYAIVSRPMAQALREAYPDVENLSLIEIWNPRLAHEGQYFSDDAFYFVEPAFLDIFSFPLLEGNRETALSDPNALLMTESMRRKYFGDAPALGQTLVLNDSLTFTVTGVLADIPVTSHFQPDFLVPQAASQMVASNPQRDAGWLWLDSSAYLMLKEGTDPAAFEAKIRDLLTENYADGLAGMQATAEVGIEPLTGIHLHSNYASQFGGNGNIRYVYALAAIAIFVLLIACFNFMNLTTAQSLERAKEVGVRKVVGSSQGALIRQFMTESSLVTLVAVGLGVALAALLLPFFNQLSGAELSLNALRHPVTLFFLAGLILTTGLLAGSYPAFVLSRFRPVEV